MCHTHVLLVYWQLFDENCSQPLASVIWRVISAKFLCRKMTPMPGILLASRTSWRLRKRYHGVCVGGLALSQPTLLLSSASLFLVVRASVSYLSLSVTGRMIDRCNLAILHNFDDAELIRTVFDGGCDEGTDVCSAQRILRNWQFITRQTKEYCA